MFRRVRIYFIIVNFRIKGNPEQQSTCILSSKHSFLVDKRKCRTWDSWLLLYTNTKRQDQICFVSKENEPQVPGVSFERCFSFPPLVWERLLRHNMWSGRTNRRTRHSKQYATMRTSCYLLHDGNHMGTASRRTASPGWKHIPGTFQVWINTKTSSPNVQFTQIPQRKLWIRWSMKYWLLEDNYVFPL